MSVLVNLVSVDLTQIFITFRNGKVTSIISQVQ